MCLSEFPRLLVPGSEQPPQPPPWLAEACILLGGAGGCVEGGSWGWVGRGHADLRTPGSCSSLAGTWDQLPGLSLEGAFGG